MNYIDDAGKLWHRFWSVRLSVAAAVCGGAAAALPFCAPEHPSRGFALVIGLVTVAAPLLSLASAGSRVVKQKKLAERRDG
jgi:hypothetical protein